MKLKSGQTLPGNPKQGSKAPGAGRTVEPDKTLPSIWHYKRYWEVEIGKTSRNIHRKRKWEL